jgi:uncharacterized protein (DUF736 family)
MADIGTFKKSGQGFQGEIRTLSVQAKGIRIVPEANRGNDNAPSHRRCRCPNRTARAVRRPPADRRPGLPREDD